MSKSKMREDFRKMTKWSIRKMFENHPDGIISLRDLHKELDTAWQDLCDDGEITTEGGDDD